MSREAFLTFDPLDELLDRRNPANPKSHDLATLAESIARFGFVTPPTVNDGDGHLVEGHGRLEALEAIRRRGGPPPAGIQVREDGRWHVPAIHGIDLSPADAAAFLVAANRTVELGGWDETKLLDLLKMLSDSEGGLEATGFALADIDELLASLGSEIGPDPDDAPKPRPLRDVRVTTGDLVILGEHRLICGDATDGEIVQRVTGVDRPACLWTDPPYGVQYTGRTKQRLTIANDNARDLSRLLRRAFAAVDAVLAAGATVYVCHPAGPLSQTVVEAFLNAGWSYRQGLVWVKDSLVPGHSDYQYRHEPVLYGFKPGRGRHGRGGLGWYGGNDAASVFEVPRPRASHDHPTMKPTRLVEAMVKNSTRRGDTLIDPFSGSGSTLIACELLGRRFVGIEIDPVYVQVTIDRWERYTRRKATVESA